MTIKSSWNEMVKTVWIAVLLIAISAIALSPQSVLAQSEDDAAEATESSLPSEVLNPAISIEELELRLVPLTKSDLEELAAAWLGIVKAKTENVMEAQIKILNSEGAEAQQTREALTKLTEERGQLFKNYNSVINAWEKKGGDEAAIADYRAYRSSIIVEETRTADVQTLMTQAISWAISREGGIQLAIDIAVIVASIFGLLFVARIIRGFIRKWIGRVPNLSKLLQAFMVTFFYWIVLAVGLMVVLSALGIDVSPVFALIGGASFILAFAFQDTLGNLASGLMIMINRPFDEGDYVDVGGVAGTVQAVSIVATTVITPDNQVIVIPNKNVWGNVITNVTASDTRRVDLVFGISYEDSIPDAIRVMEETVKAHPLVLAEPEPVVRVTELADSSVNFICRPWVKTSDYWTLYWDLMQQVKINFDAAGISIPYPQQDIHYKAIPAANPAAPKPAPAPQLTETKAESFASGDDGYSDEGGDR